MNSWHGGWGWVSWILMAVVMVLFWAAVIVLVVAAIRRLTRRQRVPTQSGSWQARARAEDALADRLARGEIDEDEYRHGLTLLSEHRRL